MPVVAVDQLQTSGKIDILQGFEAMRIITVSGLDGYPDGPSMEQAALQAAASVVGDLGSQCAEISIAPTYMKEMSAKIISADAVECRASYRSFPVSQISIKTALSELPTNIDYAKKPIVVEYNYALPDITNQDAIGNEQLQNECIRTTHPHQQTGFVTKKVLEIIITVKFTLTNGGAWVFNGATSTAMAMAANVGKVFDGPPCANAPSGTRTWMVEDFSGDSPDAGSTYSCQMAFHYRAGSWDQYVVYINPKTGKPPADLTQLIVGYDWVPNGQGFTLVPIQVPAHPEKTNVVVQLYDTANPSLPTGAPYSILED